MSTRHKIMKSILKELYFDALSDMEARGQTEKSEAFWANRENLEKSLSKEQKALFSKYEETLSVEEAKGKKAFFYYGLKMGRQLFEELES